MIISLIVEVFIKAFLLMILVYIVARDEADFEFRKMTMVTAGIVLGAVIMDATLTRFIGLFTLIPIAIFIVFMVMQFCWVRFWRALLVAVPFLILNVMISTSMTAFHQKTNSAISKGLQGPVSEEDMKIALSFYQDGGRTNEFIAAAMARKKAPKIEETLDQVLLKAFIAGLTSARARTSGGDKTKLFQPDGLKIKNLPNLMDAKSSRIGQDKTAPEKNAPEPVASAADWQEAGGKIAVKGILTGRDGMRIAIVNNQLVREGEFIQVEHKKTIYRWRARSIRDSGISWEPAEALKK